MQGPWAGVLEETKRINLRCPGPWETGRGLGGTECWVAIQTRGSGEKGERTLQSGSVLKETLLGPSFGANGLGFDLQGTPEGHLLIPPTSIPPSQLYPTPAFNFSGSLGPCFPRSLSSPSLEPPRLRPFSPPASAPAPAGPGEAEEGAPSRACRGDFPRGPVAKTPRSQCRWPGFNPCSGS